LSKPLSSIPTRPPGTLLLPDHLIHQPSKLSLILELGFNLNLKTFLLIYSQAFLIGYLPGLFS